MKNIVKVLRFKDNKVRLYEVPTSIVLERGAVIKVQFGESTALGVTVSESYCGVSEERMIRDLHNVLPGTEFKRVVAIYDKQEVAWADAPAAESAEEAVEQEAFEQEAFEQEAATEEVESYGA